VVASPVGATTASPRAGVCILWPVRGAQRSSPAQMANGAETVPSLSAEGSGNVTVAIPPVVLIRTRDHRLVVTTNTGKPPQAQDTFYYIAHAGSARLARPALRQRVLSKCAGQSPSPSLAP
jgi:hypothetical protein